MVTYYSVHNSYLILCTHLSFLDLNVWVVTLNIWGLQDANFYVEWVSTEPCLLEAIFHYDSIGKHSQLTCHPLRQSNFELSLTFFRIFFTNKLKAHWTQAHQLSSILSSNCLKFQIILHKMIDFQKTKIVNHYF